MSAFCGLQVVLPPRFLASAGPGRPHRRGDGEEDGGGNPGSLRPAGCAGQQRRDPGHGRHRDARPGPVRQGHEHQREVGFLPDHRTKYEAAKKKRRIKQNGRHLNLEVGAQ